MDPAERSKKKYIVNLSTTVLLVIQILCGFIVILLGEYFKNLLKRILSDVEHFEIFTIILFIELSGIYLITLYLCGIIIIKITKFSRYTTHLVGLLRLWLIVSVQAGTGSLIVALICNNTLHQLENTLEMTFVNSIKCYYSDANWKLIWDELQYNVQCCGVYGYTDWLNKTVLLDGTGIVWVKLNIAITNPWFNLFPRSLFSSLAPRIRYHFVPYSCCKRDTMCNEETMLDLNIYIINQTGCYDEIMDRTVTVIHQIIVTHVFVFVIEVRLWLFVSFNLCSSNDPFCLSLPQLILLVVFKMFINMRSSNRVTTLDYFPNTDAESAELLQLNLTPSTQMDPDPNCCENEE